MKYIALVLLALTSAFGQITLSPPHEEFGKKAKGEFRITNESFNPMAVSLEMASAAVVNGKFTIKDQVPTTHIKLSEYSARISAKQTKTFAYQITCDTLPCVAVVLITASVGHDNEGVTTALRLGHIVYICEKQKACRDSYIEQIEVKK